MDTILSVASTVLARSRHPPSIHLADFNKYAGGGGGERTPRSAGGGEHSLC